MGFEEGIRLIEKADEKDAVYRMLEENGEDYCEPDELEARQDEAYKDHHKACMELAQYLQNIMVNIEYPVVRQMAFSADKRAEMMKLFKSAK